MEVAFPNELLVALREEPDGFRQKVLVYTLGKLYELGRISGGFGAQILGCDLWEFYRLLSENGFAVIDYPEDDWTAESDALDKVSTLQSPRPNQHRQYVRTRAARDVLR